MVRTIWNAIKALPGLGERVRREPIIVMSLAIAAMQAFMQAQGDGLGSEDTFVFVAQAVVTWLGRELVYPAVKVHDANNGLYVEEALPPPATGDDLD